MTTADVTSILLTFLLTNGVWLFVLGLVLWLAGRKWRRRAVFWHLFWVLLLVKILLPPVANWELGVLNGKPNNKTSEAERIAISGQADSLPVLTSAAQETVQHFPPEVVQTSAAKFVPDIMPPKESEAKEHVASLVLHDAVPATESQVDSAGDSNIHNADMRAAFPEVGLPVEPDSAESSERFSKRPMTVAALIFRGTVVAWFLGTLCVFLVSLQRIVRFRRCLAETEPADAETQRLADEIAAQLGLSRSVDVRVVDACLPPMVWAFFSKPVVLFPKQLLAQLAPEQRSLLLAHELAHLKRRDHWVRYLEWVCTMFYWWHPMLWLARRELREAEELCCDAWATWLFPGKNRDYGRALLATIDYLSEDETTSVPVPAVGSGMSMRETKRRIEMILKSNNPRTLSWPLRVLFVMLALLILPFSATLTAKPSPEEQAPVAENAAQETSAETPLQEHRLAPGDLLAVNIETVTEIPEIPDYPLPIYRQISDGDSPPAKGILFSVDKDGALALPRLFGKLKVEGMTITEMQALVRRVYVDIMKILAPEATISISLIFPDDFPISDKAIVEKAYYVNDLARPANIQPGGGDRLMPVANDINAIIDYIRAEVAPDSWNEETMIFPVDLNAILLVKQTEAVHAEIAKQIVGLRKDNHLLRSLKAKEAAALEATEETPQYVDETFDLLVRLDYSYGEIRVKRPYWYAETMIELWDHDLISGESKMIASKKANEHGFVVFENLVRPIDARRFDQKTRQEFDKPVEVKELHEYRVFAMAKDHAIASLLENVWIRPSDYPKTAEEHADFSQYRFESLAMYDIGNIAGLVTSEDGMPITGAKVSVTSELQNNGITKKFFARNCETDMQGRFNLEDVPKTIPLDFNVETEKSGRFSMRATYMETMKITLPSAEMPQQDERFDAIFESASKLTEQVSGFMSGDMNSQSQMIDLPKDRQYTATAATATFQVVEDATGNPLQGVTVLVKAKDDAPQARMLSNVRWQNTETVHENLEFTFVTDENGMVSFRYPKKLMFLDDDRSERLRYYEIHIRPYEKDGKKLCAGLPGNDLAFGFPSGLESPEDPWVLPMQKLHLLIGRVVDAETNMPLAKTDDGNTIRVGFSPRAWNGEGYPNEAEAQTIVDVDENGLFQCYRFAGVSWPYLLPNGEDNLWTRTEDYQRWQSEGVLVKPDSITTLTFRVKRRLDKDSPTWPTPVAEEVPVATKLIALGADFGVNEHKHIQSITLNLETRNDKLFDLETAREIGQLPELSFLTMLSIRKSNPLRIGTYLPPVRAMNPDMLEGFAALEYLNIEGFQLSPEVIEKIAEKKSLRHLTLGFVENDPPDLKPLLKLENLEMFSLRGGNSGGDFWQGKDAIEAYLRGDKEEAERLNNGQQ